MSVTIKEVAQLAGVSPSTVSRVISGSDKISELTKTKVKEAMEELKYRPNFIARSLAKKTTRIIGLTIPYQKSGYIRNSFFSQVMHGICTEAQLRGYLITINYAQKEDQEVELMKELAEAKWIDGMILLTTYENDVCIEYLKSNNIPFSVIGRPKDVKAQIWVDNDNFSASYAITNYLFNCGCKDIAFVGGSNKLTYTVDRCDGYRAAVKMRGIDLKNDNIHELSELTEECGYDLAKLIFEEGKINTPDGIVCTDDKVAIGIQDYLVQNHIRCAVTGFNNSSQGKYAKPSITTVDLNATFIGQKAAKLLIDFLEFGVRGNALVETSIIERESTKCFKQ